MAIGTDREFLTADQIERIALTMPYSDYVPGECHCINTHLEDDYAIIELIMKSSGGTFRVKQQHTFHYVNCPRLTAGNDDDSQDDDKCQNCGQSGVPGDYELTDTYAPNPTAGEWPALVQSDDVNAIRLCDDCLTDKPESCEALAELVQRGLPAISGGASTETVVAAYLDGDQSAAAELRRRSIEAKRSQAVVERDTGESKSARIAKRSARRSRNRSSRRGSKQRLRYLSDAQID